MQSSPRTLPFKQTLIGASPITDAKIKAEIRMSKSERSPKSETRIGRLPLSDFEFRISFGVRISAFGFSAALKV